MKELKIGSLAQEARAGASAPAQVERAFSAVSSELSRAESIRFRFFTASMGTEEPTAMASENSEKGTLDSCYDDRHLTEEPSHDAYSVVLQRCPGSVAGPAV